MLKNLINSIFTIIYIVAPQQNYETLSHLLKFSREKHLPRKLVKCNKKKHKQSKWMTNGILKSINTKDKLYKEPIQTNHDDELLFKRLKTDFNTYRATL